MQETPAHSLLHCGKTLGNNVERWWTAERVKEKKQPKKKKKSYATVPSVLACTSNKGDCSTKTDVVAWLGPQEGYVCKRERERDVAVTDSSVSVSVSAYEPHCVSPGCVQCGGTGRCERVWVYHYICVCVRIVLLFVLRIKCFHCAMQEKVAAVRGAPACEIVHAVDDARVRPQPGELTSERDGARLAPIWGYFPGLAPALTHTSLHVISPVDPSSDPGSLPRSVTACWPPSGCFSWAMGTHTHTHMVRHHGYRNTSLHWSTVPSCAQEHSLSTETHR